MSPVLFTLVTTLILAVSAIPAPREVLWSNTTIGPDGPWNVVETQLGPAGASINLFPGAIFETWLIKDSYCQKDTCYASKAGLYDKSLAGSSGGISIRAGLDTFMLGVQTDGEDVSRWLDELSVNGQTVKNTSLALLDTQTIKYPGGQTSPLFAGCLSLGGGRETNQTFTLPDAPSINASLPPGYLWEHDVTPSNSFGLHIGSAQPVQPGSLWFGGYDKNRVAGDILEMTGDFRSGITLWDIGIDVIDGKSPFNFNTKDNLLSKEGGSGLEVQLDGCSPYITLPKKTCDNIAAELPVHFDDSLGLYLWDTSSDKYKEIVPSASALSFSFISDSNTNPIKIRVPFMHLNLTLTEPLVRAPTPYLPCHVNSNITKYVLGRAFLQDAFIGANMDPDVNKWWLAQAPGPNIQATSSVVTIQRTDGSIQKGGNNWEASWKGIWTVEAVSSASATPASDSTDGASGNTGGLSTGAKAGIGAGVGVAALALVVLAVFLLLRRRRQPQDAANQAQPQPQLQPSDTQTPQTNSVYPSTTGFSKTPLSEPSSVPPGELPSELSIQSMQHAQARSERHELP